MKKFFEKKKSYSDKIFDIVNLVIMILLVIIFVWPLWFVVVASFSDPIATAAGQTLLLPKGFSLDGYKKILQYKEIWIGYGNTLFYTIVGTLFNLVMTVCFAYPLASKDFKPRKFFLMAFMFTMYFSGGLIPGYLVVKEIGILDTRWAMILPGLISVYNGLVVRSYFMNSIPAELEEAATLDGANCAQYLMKVALPLSKPVLAVVGLYYASAHWNDFYTALIYIYDQKLMPLQYVLRNLLMSTQMMLDDTSGLTDPQAIEEAFNAAMTMKYGVIVIAAIPLLCVYPFIQKYFVKGVMVGSVKG